MANLENNKDNNEKPIEKQIGKAVDKTIDTVSKAVDDAEHLPRMFAKQAIEDASHYSWWAKLLLYLFYIGLGIVAVFLLSACRYQRLCYQSFRLPEQRFRNRNF
jgi:hypothetical protein